MDEYLRRVEGIVRDALQGYSYSLYLFGSRARGDHTHGSDYDLAVEAEDDVATPLLLARERLEESTIPYCVDLLDLRETSEELREVVRREGVLLCRQ
ncbi:MAG TPA: nucleotidyltransferase domain-containing protein [Armatimonadota bacterium]